ncbi:NAD(P)H-dependent flavin oxidoreductase [Chloroflexota bacterium]
MKKTRLCELLGIKYPVIQAPMVWITNAELVAAVSNAGGLGVIGFNAGERTVTTDVVETGECLRRQIRKVKSLTNMPFGVNVAADATPNPTGNFSDQCVNVILEEGIPVAVLVGDAPELYVKRLKDATIRVLHRALQVNIETALKAEQAGVDVLVAVGFEGGGRLGDDRIPTLALIPQIVDTLKIPVVAGGGIVDGRGMAAALALGAEGVYIGTRFIATIECPAHKYFKQAILDATDTDTSTFTGITGVNRGLKFPLVERCIQMEGSSSKPLDRQDLYRSGLRKGMLDGDMIEGAFPCGAAAGLITEVKGAADVVQEIINDADQILAKLGSTTSPDCCSS